MRPEKLWIVAIIAGMVAFGAPALLAQDGHGHHGKMQGMHGDAKAEQTGKCPICKMNEGGMKAMAEVKQLLAEAKKAADAGDARKASAKIAEAQALMEEQHKKMHKHMKQMMQGEDGEKMREHMKGMKCPMCGKMMGEQEDAGVVNKRCPIMGTKIDPAEVPEKLTREFKDKKVGFCCPGCPAKWDRLSEEEKEKKIEEAQE